MNDPLKLGSDPQRKAYLESGIWSASVCLDHLFARNVKRAPDKIILCDTPDKQQLTGLPVLDLTAQDADSIVNSIAARFQELGLEAGQVVALQMPNIVELPLTLLACMRLGLVPALLPLLWMERDVQAALDLLKPRAMVSIAKAGTLFPAETLRYAAASLFSVRHQMAFGEETPDGVISLQEIFETAPHGKKDNGNFSGKADMPALATFRMTAHGPAAVVRSHNQAISTALMPMLESHMEPEEGVILSCLQSASLAGLATGFLPWLLSGGRLIMHQVGNPQHLAQQIAHEQVTHLAVPGIALPRIAAQFGNQKSSIKSVFSVYANAGTKLPQLSAEPPFTLIDTYIFDDLALVTRTRDGKEPRLLRLGPQVAPSAGVGPALAELGITSTSRLAVRGPSVPYNEAHKEGFQHTGYLAKIEDEHLQITGRADHLAYIGGLAVSLNEVASLLQQMDGVEAVQVNAIADDVFGEILEARIHFSRSPERLQNRLEQLKKEFEARQFAPYKIPARFVIDPEVAKQETPQTQKKAG